MADAKPISALVALLLIFCGIDNSQTTAEPLTDTCLGCICDAISNCDRTLRCDGNSCGPLLITRPYWDDAGKPTLAPGESPEAADAYPRCTTDPSCSARTVALYMNKYAQDCNEDGKIDCSDYARIHLKGGNGCARSLDYDYGIRYENKLNNCYRRAQQLLH